MKKRYDIVVVGGGPAGSMAAKYSANNGASVALFEKDREIGIPVRCGEAASEEGLKQYVDIDDSWVAATIQDIRFISPSGKIVDLHSPSRGFILHRRLFDHSLALEASNQGAEIFTKAYVYGLEKTDNRDYNVLVRHIGRNLKVEAGIVIAADGVESRVGRFAGLHTQTQIKNFESCAQMTVGNININPTRIDFHFSRRWAPGGYVWVFPKGDRTANIGLGVNGKYATNRPAIDYLESFIKEKFPDVSQLTTVAGGVPVDKTISRIYADNFMIVGDAAHQVNPMTGGGIISGMAAGKIAGTVAAKAIQKNEKSSKFLKEYQKKWNEKVGKSHERYFRLKEWINDMTDEDLDQLAEMLQGIDSEDITLTKIFKLAVRKKPALLIDVAKVLAGL